MLQLRGFGDADPEVLTVSVQILYPDRQGRGGGEIAVRLEKPAACLRAGLEEFITLRCNRP
jgi:hypothetical protein